MNSSGSTTTPEGPAGTSKEDIRYWIWMQARNSNVEKTRQLAAWICARTNSMGEVIDDATLIQKDPLLLRMRTKLVRAVCGEHPEARDYIRSIEND